MTKTSSKKIKMWRVKNFTQSWQCKVSMRSKISSLSGSSISRRTCIICCSLRPAQRSTILILIWVEKLHWLETIIHPVKRSRNIARKPTRPSAATTFTPTFSRRKSPKIRVQRTIPWPVCGKTTRSNKSERQTSALLIKSSWSFRSRMRTWKSLRHKFAI